MDNPLHIPPFVFRDAIRAFWDTRERQSASKKLADQGTRGDVTAGKHMDGFALTITQKLLSCGVEDDEIYTGRTKAVLPGFFRPTKEWDLIVVRDGRLLAALELKSIVGSFGNNANNRVEEATGTALDLWTAYREGAYRASPQPFLGYLFVCEDNPKSTRTVGVGERHFAVFPEFKGASYKRRLEIFCRRLVLERHYTSACFIVTSRENTNKKQNYLEPAEDLGTAQFLTQLLRTVSTPQRKK